MKKLRTSAAEMYMCEHRGILIAVSEFDDIIHHFIQGFLH